MRAAEVVQGFWRDTVASFTHDARIAAAAGRKAAHAVVSAGDAAFSAADKLARSAVSAGDAAARRALSSGDQFVRAAPARASAIARDPKTWRRSAAGCAGAMVALAVVALAFPLALGGSASVEAATQFRQDLSRYHAAPPDSRAAPLVSAAAAAYEDRAFFARPAWLPPISPLGVARAIARNLRGIPEGGSTIPQQLAKLYLRGIRRGSLSDKAREALFAVWLSRAAPREEIAGLYLNLSASTTMGARRPADGLDRLSLALFGMPLRRLAREDQLVLGAAPRGIYWLRAHPQMSAQRLAAARAWLASQGLWDATARSYLDDAPMTAPDFRFVEGWTEEVASGGLRSADADLISAVDNFREGLADALREFPGVSVRAGFAALGPNGTVLARSGAEAALMQVNYGSVAKLELLNFEAEAFGPESVRELPLAPGKCLRWMWATSEKRRVHGGSYCPNDVQPADHPMALDEAVARSINSMTTRHAVLLPELLATRRPDLFQQVAAHLTVAERTALDSPADRALASGQYAAVGMTVAPDAVTPALSYTAAGVALFRTLKERRERAGLPAASLPDDPTQLLGNDSRATVEQIGSYLHKKLFSSDGSCTLSDTGALLALHRKEGTLRWLAQRWPKLVFTGKTGSSPHDDSAVAAVALCLDTKPVVLVAGLRPLEGTLPLGLRGSVVLRGLDSYLRELSRLSRRPDSAELPPWAMVATAVETLR
ncbi:MAG TPA: transglycosylase domain-containing protein [Myxococcales bacterium]